jgi:hypothetical protein
MLLHQNTNKENKFICWTNINNLRKYLKLSVVLSMMHKIELVCKMFYLKGYNKDQLGINY